MPREAAYKTAASMWSKQWPMERASGTACVVPQNTRWRDLVPRGSPHAKEIDALGLVYATLTARLWEGLMGVEDATILGAEGSTLEFR